MPPNACASARRHVPVFTPGYNRVRRLMMKTTTVDLMGLAMIVLVAFFVFGMLLV